MVVSGQLHPTQALHVLNLMLGAWIYHEGGQKRNVGDVDMKRAKQPEQEQYSDHGGTRHLRH
jgi:hypothetical protein